MEEYNCKIDVAEGIAFEYSEIRQSLLASFADEIDIDALAIEIDKGNNNNIDVPHANFFLESYYSTQVEFDNGHMGCGDIYEIECGEYIGNLLYETYDYDGRNFSHRQGNNGQEVAQALVQALSMLK